MEQETKYVELHSDGTIKRPFPSKCSAPDCDQSAVFYNETDRIAYCEKHLAAES